MFDVCLLLSVVVGLFGGVCCFFAVFSEALKFLFCYGMVCEVYGRVD